MACSLGPSELAGTESVFEMEGRVAPLLMGLLSAEGQPYDGEPWIRVGFLSQTRV